MSCRSFLVLFLAFFLVAPSGASSSSFSIARSLAGGRKLIMGIAAEVKQSVAGGASRVVSVNDFGARGDGESDDTEAFAAAWKAACSSSEPVTMLIPEEKSYRLKHIVFSGPCKSAVTISIKGTILASEKISDWDGTDRRFWILFDQVDGLSVQGGGTLDGNGQAWWKLSCKKDPKQTCKEAPTALTFRSCNRLSVDDLQLKNSQQMHVTFSDCAGVRASGLTVSSPTNSPNTDGVHVSGSTDVKISDAVIATGDDCISIVAGSSAVAVTNVVCGPGHGISIGSLGAKGAVDTVSDVVVDTATLRGTTNGVRIKSWQGGRGYARNIVFKNIIMDNVQNPIIIDQNYCDSQKPCSQQMSAVSVSGVTYQNIKGTSATEVAIDFACSSTVPCQGITLQNVNLVTLSGAPAESFFHNAKLSTYGTVAP